VITPFRASHRCLRGWGPRRRGVLKRQVMGEGRGSRGRERGLGTLACRYGARVWKA